MGIPGLLPFVKSACREGNLREFSGKTIAVDVSCLLHKGVFGCVHKLVKGQETNFYVEYVRRHVNVLLALNCRVILVFDGQPLPAKKEINDIRKEKREKNTKLGEKLMAEGLTSEANRAFRQGITITKEMVETTIQALRNTKFVDIIVAPFEADAQIAYLLQNGMAHVVVTEDSDYIVFGCEKVAFKMEIDGSCLIYEKSKLSSCVCPIIQKRFDFSVFRRICILAGCDYLLGGLAGVGLKKAELFFAKTMCDDLKKILPRIPLYLNMNTLKVDDDFINEFVRAENTFLYQIVFNPTKRELCPLNAYPISGDSDSPSLCADYAMNSQISERFWYAGKMVPSNEAFRRALGNMDLSGPPIRDNFVLPLTVPNWSIWSSDHGQFIAKVGKDCSERFGAFTVKQPVNKRPLPRIPLIDIDYDEELELIAVKKRRSEPVLSDNTNAKTLRNGPTMNWNSSNWMKIYGAGLKSKNEQESLSSSSNAASLSVPILSSSFKAMSSSQSNDRHIPTSRESIIGFSFDSRRKNRIADDDKENGSSSSILNPFSIS